MCPIGAQAFFTEEVAQNELFQMRMLANKLSTNLVQYNKVFALNVHTLSLLGLTCPLESYRTAFLACLE